MNEVVTVLKDFQGQRPLPLVRRVSPAEAFPVEALGEVLGSAAMAIHDYVQSPLAICGQAVLAAPAPAPQRHAPIGMSTRQSKTPSNLIFPLPGSCELKT